MVLDNLGAHKDSRVGEMIAARGATLHPLPQYAHDMNPIEPGWSLIKKQIRAAAERSGPGWQRVAQHAWHAIRPRHCRNWVTQVFFGIRP